MSQAILEAKKAFAQDEVPVGAVLVHKGKVIGKGYNQIESLQDASMHAELICLRQGARFLGNWRLKGCILYSTLEPCAMCAGAMQLFRLSTLVYGAFDLRHGAIDLLLKPHPIHSVDVPQGKEELSGFSECGELMRTFFRKKREEKSG